MRAIVLAGGLGTRLRDLVPDLPKPMAPIAGRPFLEYVLDGLLIEALDEIVLAVGYRAELIQQHFGRSYRGKPISYSVEVEQLGTGGAIAAAAAPFGDEPVIVVNGDTLVQVNYTGLLTWYWKEPVPVAMVLKKADDVSRYGAVVTRAERVVGFEEKGRTGPGLINAGIYIVEPRIFADFAMPRRFSFETDLLQRHCGELVPRAFLTDSYFVDIGLPESLERARRELPSLHHV